MGCGVWEDAGEKQGQKKKQIPCGNDKRNCKGKGKNNSKRRSRFPAGMTNKRSKGKGKGKGRGKGRGGFPEDG